MNEQNADRRDVIAEDERNLRSCDELGHKIST